MRPEDSADIQLADALSDRYGVKFARDPRVHKMDRLYRIFERPEYANAFCAGEVWLSSLEKCRNTEDGIRKDAGEGTLEYNSGTAIGSSGDPAFDEVVRRLGMPVQGLQDSIIHDCRSFEKTSDAFVLCTSDGSLEELLKFGAHCVEITRPFEFLLRLTPAIAERHELAWGVVWKVDYRPRVYQGLEEHPGFAPFVKPDSFSDEKEVRFIWHPRELDLVVEPGPVLCPEVVHLCRRLS